MDGVKESGAFWKGGFSRSGGSEYGPAPEPAGTPGAAGSVSWLSHWEKGGYLLSGAHGAPGCSDFTLGNGLSRNAHMCRRHEGAGLSSAAACGTAQAPGGRRVSVALADPQPRVWWELAGGFSVLCPGEKPREGCLSGCCCAVEAPCSERCEMFSFLSAHPVSAEKVFTAIGKRNWLCVYSP